MCHSLYINTYHFLYLSKVVCVHLYAKIAIVVQSKHSLIKLASYGLEWQYCSINTISRILNSCKCLIVKTCFCYDIERVNVFVGRISNKLCTLLNLFLRIDFQWQMLQHVTTRISNEGILLSYNCGKIENISLKWYEQIVTKNEL